MARIRPGFRLRRGQNLADLTDKAAARQALELGSAALSNNEAFSRSNHLHDDRYPTRDGVSVIGFDNGNTGRPYMRAIAGGDVYHLQRELGFTPVQQGGGLYMSVNKIKIGWDGPASFARLEVDATQMGALWADNCAQRRMAEVIGADSLGSYAFMRSAQPSSRGQHVAGSQLTFSSAGGDLSFTASGTWRCMGFTSGTGTGPNETTLWMRVA